MAEWIYPQAENDEIYLMQRKIQIYEWKDRAWDDSKTRDWYTKLFLILNCRFVDSADDAGAEGIEPPSKVLETSILPLNYAPSLDRRL